MSKSTTFTVSLDEDAYGVFQSASEVVSKAGIRVPTGQLVQTMINAEMSRLSAREIAQRFLKSIMKNWYASLSSILKSTPGSKLS